jgi:peptidylprolyl isomerase
MSKKQNYKLANEEYLANMATEEGVVSLPSGVLYKVIKNGDGKVSPTKNSVVTVHYTGTLINGRKFDSSKGGVAPAFRLSELIVGWQEALTRMRVGDKWMVYIPARFGYGSRTSGDIPGNSTLVFEIELFSIA